MPQVRGKCFPWPHRAWESTFCGFQHARKTCNRKQTRKTSYLQQVWENFHSLTIAVKDILSKESVGIFQSWEVWEDMNAYPGEYKMLPLTARSGTQAS